MFCTKCGTENVGDASFCEQCGAPFPKASSGSAAVQPKKQKKRPWKVFALCAAAVIACMAVFVMYRTSGSDAFADSTFFQHDRLLVLTTEDQYTYINSQGEFALEDAENSVFSNATPFGSNGLAIVEPATQSGSYYIIDTNGRKKAEVDLSAYVPENEHLLNVWFGSFDGQGCALFRLHDASEGTDFMGMVDEKGRVVIAPEYDMLTQMSAKGYALGYHGTTYDTMTCVRISRSGKTQPVSGLPFPTELLSGDFSFCPQEDSLTPAYDLEVPLEGGTIPRAIGYLDASGEWAIPPQYCSASRFVQQRAIVSDGKQRHGIDMNGSKVFSLESGVYCESFTEDSLARIKVYEEDASVPSYGYVDLNGNIVVEPSLYSAREFSNGYASVLHDRLDDLDGYAYIDTSGYAVTAHAYYRANDFDACGYAAIQMDINSDTWIYIDASGQQAVPGEFYIHYYGKDFPPSFFDPFCKVAIAAMEEDGPLCLINTNGEQVGSAEFAAYLCA